jgi:segregation and condensation protein A
MARTMEGTGVGDSGTPFGFEVSGTEKACADREAEMINHLLFHKAIIREPGDRTVDIDNYMGILRELDQGMHVVLDNPVDRAVAIAFQLVIDERFDPWNLDLVEFTKLYLERIRKESDVNFIIAGRLVMMAWSILKRQSEHVLTEADRTEPQGEYYFEGWDVCGIGEAQQRASYTDMILGSDAPPLAEAVRSSDVRPVTLMSLIEAFDEAREEMALRERIKKFAVKETYAPVRIGDKLHNESLQEDISITWQRICKCDGQLIPMNQLWNGGDVWDRVTVFVSTLFLAKMQKILLTQRRFPKGEIMIRNIEGSDSELRFDKGEVDGLPDDEPEEVPVEESRPEKKERDETGIESEDETEAIQLEDLAVV